MNILQINSSIRGSASHSTHFANEIVKRLRDSNAKGALTVHHLGSENPAPQLDEAALQALFTPADQRTPAQAALVAQADALIAELKAADVLVLGVPMYNFALPASLKNWIDAVCRAEVTFKYTDTGPIGLVTGKKVYVALARGGLYRDTPNDTQVPYLRMTLAFLGMTDVEFIYAEGINMGPEAQQKGLAEAQAQIDALFATEMADA